MSDKEQADWFERLVAEIEPTEPKRRPQSLWAGDKLPPYDVLWDWRKDNTGRGL